MHSIRQIKIKSQMSKMIHPVEILTLEEIHTQSHIIREFHTYPENFMSPAIIAWAGHRRRRKRRKLKKTKKAKATYLQLVPIISSVQSKARS